MRTKRLFTFPLVKVDEQADGSVIVRGTATSETIDSQGDVMTFESSKEALGTYAGNIREMHQSKAVGRAVDIKVDEDARAIHVEALISSGAPDTVQLLKDGVLRGFSVGGEIKSSTTEKREGKNVRVVTKWDWHELSLVDVGANPDANNLVMLCKLADPAPDVDPYAALAAKRAKKPAKLAKGYGTWDLRCAVDCLEDLKMLRESEMWEEMEGDEANAAAQVAKIDAAISALSDFIGLEANELGTGEEDSSPELAAARGLGMRAMRKLLSRDIAKATSNTFSKTDSEKMTAAILKSHAEDLEAIQETLSTVKADAVREQAETRKEMAAQIAKMGVLMDRIAGSPFLAGAPIAKTVTGQPAAGPVDEKAIIRKYLAGAANRAPSAAQPFISNEMALHGTR